MSNQGSPARFARRAGLFTPIAVFVLAMALPALAQASHFRYGQIAWDRVSGNAVEFTVTTAWRTSPFVQLNFGDSSSVSGSMRTAR